MREYKANKEQALIDEAKRDEVVKSISDPEIRAKLEQQIEEERDEDGGLILNNGTPVKVHVDDFEIVDSDVPFTLDELQSKIENLDIEISEIQERLEAHLQSLFGLQDEYTKTEDKYDLLIDKAKENESVQVSLRIKKVKALKEISAQINAYDKYSIEMHAELQICNARRADLLTTFSRYYE